MSEEGGVRGGAGRDRAADIPPGGESVDDSSTLGFTGPVLQAMVGSEALVSTATFSIDSARTTIGRSGDCDVEITDATVSRLHAEIIREGETFRLIQSSASNPTRLNGADVRESALLANGDEIEISGLVTFRVVLEPSGNEPGGARIASHHLVMIAPEPGATFPLRDQITTVGRGERCDIRITDPTVSRLHAEIVHEDGRFSLIHRSALNRTSINGLDVRDEVEVRTGDAIRLALGVEFRLEALADADVPAPPDTVGAPEQLEEQVPTDSLSPPRVEPGDLEGGDTPRDDSELKRSPETPSPSRTAPKVLAPEPASVDVSIGEIELAIVGAGPAGLAAAVQAAKRGVNHFVLERSSVANTIERYQKGKWVMDEPPRLPIHGELEMGFEAGTRESILEEWYRAVEESGAKILTGPEYELATLEGSIGNFLLQCKGGERFHATHVVLSMGVQGNLRTFGVPGDELPHVTYQLDDPADHIDKRVIVAGVGDAGIENALALAENDNHVTVLNRGTEIVRAKARNRSLIEAAIKKKEIDYYTNATVASFEEAAAIIKTDEGEVRLDADLVIGRLGAVAPRRLLENMGIAFPRKDANAVPDVTEAYETNVPGLHIVGALAGYPLIKNCMNQGFEVVERILRNPVTPADEPVLSEKFAEVDGSVSDILEMIRRNVSLLAGLTTVQLREFLFDSEVHRLSAGDVIFERNDFSNSLYVILEGDVDIALPASDIDREATAMVSVNSERNFELVAGNFFGEISLVSGRRRSGTATAKTDCVLIESPRLAMVKLLRSVDSAREIIDGVFIERTLDSLLQDASPAMLKSASREAEVLEFRPGDVLFSEGDEPDGLHLIRRGSVMVSQKRDGRDVVLQYVQAGNYIGERALLADGRTRSATVTASVSVETVRIKPGTIAAFLESNPALRREFQRREAEYASSATPDPSGTVMFLVKDTGAHEATDLLLIDESLCVRCDNCEKACADTHSAVSRLDREAGPTYMRTSGSQLHVPTACQHCENPKCMNDCPPDALRRHPDGEVYILDNCIGCGNCYSNCPYGVIQMAAVEEHRPRGPLWDLLFGPLLDLGGRGAKRKKETESHGEHAVKCDLCRDRPARRQDIPKAACVSACPTGALVRVNPRDFIDEIRGEDPNQ